MYVCVCLNIVVSVNIRNCCVVDILSMCATQLTAALYVPVWHSAVSPAASHH